MHLVKLMALCCTKKIQSLCSAILNVLNIVFYSIAMCRVQAAT